MPEFRTADDDLLALTLFSTWAVRTGRTLRAAHPEELTEDELIEFWAEMPVPAAWRPPPPERSGADPG
ncbi:hypothetical protein ACRYCC_21525 [Actinomadura scrupuli]|uniref:hypothetical protein n=1 Tax=Actinomadura scrupuli TaxID=559629 RepID=UPI003D95535B